MAVEGASRTPTQKTISQSQNHEHQQIIKYQGSHEELKSSTPKSNINSQTSNKEYLKSRVIFMCVYGNSCGHMILFEYCYASVFQGKIDNQFRLYRTIPYLHGSHCIVKLESNFYHFLNLFEMLVCITVTHFMFFTLCNDIEQVCLHYVFQCL